MRFALLGDHPDGLEMACALVRSRRHALVAYSGPADGVKRLRDAGAAPTVVGDAEEILADPGVEAVIVASNLTSRAAQLRRALQSERHVVCVYPPDLGPDVAYEAAMIQADTGCLLLPLLPMLLHPALDRLAREIAAAGVGDDRIGLIEIRAAGSMSAAGTVAPVAWQILRAVGGDIAELSAYAGREHPEPTEPILVAGRFENGFLFQATCLAITQEDGVTVRLSSKQVEMELHLEAAGQHARLVRRDTVGELTEERWQDWDPWPVMVNTVDCALAIAEQHRAGSARQAAISSVERPLDKGPQPREKVPSWTDVIRLLEVDDEAGRSIQRRRASTLEHQEATEEATFKGTMTLLGCGMLWVMLAMLILSRWLPRLGAVILILLVVFLALQALRWVVRRSPARVQKH
jgi:predicted dehydrogenase